MNFMISQEYLNLVADLTYVPDDTSIDIAGAYDSLVYDYHNDGSVEHALLRLARHGFSALCNVRGNAHLVKGHLIELHHNKNAGYSGYDPDPWSNFRNSLDFGVSPFQGALIRLADKVTRYKNVLANNELDKVNEPITTLLEDIPAYALIALCLLREEKQFSMEEYRYAVAI